MRSRLPLPAASLAPTPTPQFSPSPSRPPRGARLGSPQGGYGDGLLPPGLAGARYHAGGPGLQYSPDTSLAYLAAASAQSSLEPGGPGGLPQQQTPSLLAQLQQIWGEGGEGGGGGKAAPAGAQLPAGYGGQLDASVAAAAMLASTQQQQQLAALLLMQQQLELQGRAGAGGTPGRRGHLGGGAGPDSAPLSPQQLPPASADMLREVLGSPLSPLHRAAWPGGSGGSAAAAGGAASADSLEAAGPSLSLGAEMSAAAAMALRLMGEPESPAHPAGAGAPPGARPGAARSLAEAVQSAAQRCSLDRASFDRASAGGARGPPAHRLDSMDLEALGFTESGEAE